MKLQMNYVQDNMLLIATFDGLQEWSETSEELEEMGWTPERNNFNGLVAMVPDKPMKTGVLVPPPPMSFCPYHTKQDKKWEDRRDGGYYCGHKNPDSSWCGYKVDEDGEMIKPPKMMPDYKPF